MENDPPNSSALPAPALVAPVGSSTAVEARRGKPEVVAAPEKGSACVTIDVGRADEGMGEWEDGEVEKTCRICHLSSERKEQQGTELIQLGCSCKGDLGIAHQQCAEAWFKVKGNRCCEICGANAKNITGVEDGGRFMEEWHESRELSNGSSSDSSCWRRRPICNFLITCLIISFLLPWFFRVNMF